MHIIPCRSAAAPLALILTVLLSQGLAAEPTTQPPQNGALLAADAPWRLLLKQQINAGKACVLNEILSFNEFELGKDKVLEGRVSCIDGREFTFVRRREHQKFEFQLCEPTVC